MRIMVVKEWSKTRERQEHDRRETVGEYYDKIPRYIITTTPIQPYTPKTTILAFLKSTS